jgi:hypothetical protein
LYWHKNWYEDQWNRIQVSDMNPHNNTHLNFYKLPKNVQCRIDSIFNKCCWEEWLSDCRKLKQDQCV